MSDNNKVIIIDFVLNSLENGATDENIARELVAILALAKTIKNPFDKYIAIEQINSMIKEQVA